MELIFKDKRKIALILLITVLVIGIITGSIYKIRLNSYISCVSRPNEYYLGGEVVGIKLLASGVLVVGVDRKDSEINVGDIILKVNNESIETDSKLQEFVSKGENLELLVLRNNQEININVLPILNEETNMYRLGLWVKDSSAGVGTITFYTEDRKFAALGHAITETNENYILPITSGGITKTSIYGIRKGVSKIPGELKGIISNNAIGEIFYNTENGIFGTMEKDDYLLNEKVKIADKEDIEVGNAKIYATIDENSKKAYDIKIEKVYLNSSGNKNIAIRVTDKELIEKTGGIVQGMSGAPIVQNGKLIGVVTHVLLDDPLSGYATFIENLVEDLEKF